jgi:hypothetical protein
MTGLDIKIHKNDRASIKDERGDVIISDVKWNSLFAFLTNLFERFYFRGDRKWVNDSEFSETIDFLSEKILINNARSKSELLFRIKTASMLQNRRLLSRMWEYYEFPAIVFLGSEQDEETLVECYKNRAFNEDILNNIESVLILHRHTEPDVLWIRTNIGIEKALLFL